MGKSAYITCEQEDGSHGKGNLLLLGIHNPAQGGNGGAAADAGAAAYQNGGVLRHLQSLPAHQQGNGEGQQDGKCLV